MKKIFGSLVIVFLMMMLGHVSVNAEAVYDASDIERIYITSETALSSLQKEYADARVEVVLKDGTVEISDFQASVKLRGNSTSKAEKKPFKVKFSTKQSVLGMDPGKKWNLLANAFDKTLIRNKLAFELADQIGLKYISQSRFVDVYYNGILQGNYLITEPVESGKNQVDIEETETSADFMIELERERYESDVTYVNSKSGVRFAINVPETPTATQTTGIKSYVDKTETALKTYKLSEYEKYIDVDSFDNYYIVCEIFKAVDFNYSSTRFYVKDGKMYAGPIWDVDLSSGNASSKFYKDYYKDGVSYKDLYCTEMKWYHYLIQSDEFVQKVNARLHEIYPIVENMYQTNARGVNRIDFLTETYQKSFARNYADIKDGGAGWSLTKRYSVCDNPQGLELDPQPAAYEENVSLLKSWLSNRVSYLEKEWAGIKNNYVDSLVIEKKSSVKVHLSWFNHGVADGNEIYLKIAKGKYKLVKTIKNGLTQECTIKNIKPGVKYSFRVRSYILSASGKVYSDYVSKSKKLKLKSPKLKIKKISNNRRKLTWKKTAGADGYVIYGGSRKKNLKKLKTIKGVQKTSYLKKNIKSGKKYYFKVKAYVKVQGKKYYSK